MTRDSDAHGYRARGRWERIESLLERHRHLLAENFEDILEYFKRMERLEKPATELEIYAHCKAKSCPYSWEKSCEQCPDSDPKVLGEIMELKAGLEELGYFCFPSPRFDLCVSRLRSVAYWLSKAVPPYKNAGVRGLLLGYSFKEVVEYVERTREDEIGVDSEEVREVEVYRLLYPCGRELLLSQLANVVAGRESCLLVQLGLIPAEEWREVCPLQEGSVCEPEVLGKVRAWARGNKIMPMKDLEP